MSPIDHTDLGITLDGPQHVDLIEHMDLAHVDTAGPVDSEEQKHDDWHSDLPHGDAPHGDHQDWIHDDSAHGDFKHYDQHGDHNDNSLPTAEIEALFERFLSRTADLIGQLESQLEQKIRQQVTTITEQANRAFAEVDERLAGLETRVSELESRNP